MFNYSNQRVGRIAFWLFKFIGNRDNKAQVTVCILFDCWDVDDFHGFSLFNEIKFRSEFADSTWNSVFAIANSIFQLT
jgi:glycosylphosphatidylinositol transamidase (GPIT) subunit GPI8